MKKFIIIAATAFVSMSSFANVDPVNGRVLEAFRSSFADAKNVEWKSLDESGLFQATFNYQNSELSAFYSEEGEMVAVARYINKNNLPIMVTKSYPGTFSGACYSNSNRTYFLRCNIIPCYTQQSKDIFSGSGFPFWRTLCIKKN